jgi:hypothetical protein
VALIPTRDDDFENDWYSIEWSNADGSVCEVAKVKFKLVGDGAA